MVFKRGREFAVFIGVKDKPKQKEYGQLKGCAEMMVEQAEPRRSKPEWIPALRGLQGDGGAANSIRSSRLLVCIGFI